ncbi:T-complex protein 11-domain-containing protein [Rhizophagus clarus]|uniref:T-complex protein 11-domain-containing protein n=1 Tax=Rhizophagus clarus TaxID=94130 RepID=A0A8H3M781_9GLOM|nr:T-complex protein 11-domain-containing protein [Rhizophagus clarus]
MKSKKSFSSYRQSHGDEKLLQYGPYDAQIKREAILEQRRLKLARQYLHVKDVLIKQHQRALRDSSAKRSHIQQTLRLAEKNRNTILQRLVEQCAQEVARCKEVARQQQLKNQEEIDRRRANLERRQRATAARRAKLLTVPKSRIFSNETAIPPTREEAAVIIQNHWRYRQLSKVIKTYRSFGISVHVTENLSFQDTVRLLQKPAVIQATGKLLQKARKVSPLTCGANRYKNLSRVFLSAYMIVSHTNEILADIGHFERKLLTSAKVMLRELEHWLNEFSNDEPNKIHVNHLLSFLSAWDTYYNDFDNWKSKDSEKLASNLIAHYVELEKLWNTVKTQANAETEWRMNIVQQQEEIKSKIRNLGGDETISRLERCLRRLKEKLPNEGGDETDTTDSVTGVNNEQEAELIKEQESNTPPRQKFVPSPLVTKVSNLTQNSSELMSKSSSTTSYFAVSPSTSPLSSPLEPSTNTDLHRIMQSLGHDCDGLTNEQLAHEIIIDPEFELQPPKRTELEERVRSMATKAFFDSARADFEKGKYDVWIPNLLSDIKQRLVDLVPPTSPLQSSINEILDIDLIKQQTKVGVYNIRNCIVYITNTMLQICAPVRDEQIQELKNVTDLAEIFKRILEILDQMRLDLANYRVKAFRSYLKEHAVDYERRKFELALKSNRLTLDRTRTWLTPTIDSFLRTVAERNPENVYLPQHKHNHGIKFDQVYNEALVSFIFQQSIIDKNSCPETFLLDVERLWNFQNEGQAITIVAALLMLTKNVATNQANFSSDDDNLPKLKDTLFVLLLDGDTTIDNLTAEILNYLPSSLSSETQSLVKSMVSKTLSQSDKVFSLLSRRIQGVVKQHLQTGQFPKKETLAQYGVLTVAKELEQLSKKICVLGRYNREVYASWYDTVIKEHLSEIKEANKKKKQAAKGKLSMKVIDDKRKE